MRAARQRTLSNLRAMGAPSRMCSAAAAVLTRQEAVPLRGSALSMLQDPRADQAERELAHEFALLAELLNNASDDRTVWPRPRRK